MIAPTCGLFPGHDGRGPGDAEGSRRRRYLTAVAVLVVVALLLLPVALGYRSQWEQLRARPATGSPREGVAPAPGPPPGEGVPPGGARGAESPDADWVQFTGTDPLETTVDHGGGLMLVRVAHRGQGPFAVRIDDFLVDVTGAYQGSRAFGLPAGTYRVGVAADDRWGVAIEQPDYAEALRLPQTLEGVGDTATRPFELGASRTVRMTWTVEHDGEPPAAGRALRVRVLDVSGTVVAELRAGDGEEVEQRLAAGRYLLDVSTDAGVWRVLMS